MSYTSRAAIQEPIQSRSQSSRSFYSVACRSLRQCFSPYGTSYAPTIQIDMRAIDATFFSRLKAYGERTRTRTRTMIYFIGADITTDSDFDVWDGTRTVSRIPSMAYVQLRDQGRTRTTRRVSNNRSRLCFQIQIPTNPRIHSTYPLSLHLPGTYSLAVAFGRSSRLVAEFKFNSARVVLTCLC